MHRIFQLSKHITALEAFVCFLVLVSLVAGGFYVLNERAATRQYTATSANWPLIARQVTIEDHLVGDPSAPIQVIAYSSIACKYCKQLFENQVPRLQKAFGDQIVVVYRHNPIPQVPGAQIQEPASECVYQLGGNVAFWEFVTLLFPVAQEAFATDITYLGSLAAQAGVSTEAFAACMRAGQGDARVAQDKQEAAVAGMATDPSLLLRSPHRALILYGDFYSQIYASIQYLIDTEARINSGSS